MGTGWGDCNEMCVVISGKSIVQKLKWPSKKLEISIE